MKLTLLFWKKKLFQVFIIFSLFCSYLPLKKETTLHLNNLNHLYPRKLCAKFGWNWPSGSGEEDENVKSLRHRRQRQRRRTTDKFWSEKPTWAFGTGELKKKHWEKKNDIPGVLMTRWVHWWLTKCIDLLSMLSLEDELRAPLLTAIFQSSKSSLDRATN